MGRFDAATPADRRKLFVDAIVAHRNRSSAYVTIEIDEETVTEADNLDAELGIPWVQFSDGIVNLDCTDAELERLKELRREFPAFKIADLNRPDDTDGTNARVSAKADPNRIAQFLDATFQQVYALPEDYRAWVVEI